MWLRRVVRAVRPQAPLRPADGGAARALGPGPGQDRALGRRPVPRALRVPPRLPRESARSRMRLRALGEAADEGIPTDGLRPRCDRSHTPRKALAPVLVLLRLQRLEQHARGRLGDDPARLSGQHGARGALAEAARDRLQPARGRREGNLGPGQARAGRRDASGSAPCGRLARQLLRRGALPRQLGVRGSRLRQHQRADGGDPPGCADHPQRPGRSPGLVPLDRLHRSLGRAAEAASSTGPLART